MTSLSTYVDTKIKVVTNYFPRKIFFKYLYLLQTLYSNNKLKTIDTLLNENFRIDCRQSKFIAFYKI